MKTLAVFFVLFTSLTCLAQNGLQKYMAFENTLENRVKAIVHPIDPNAQVFTKVRVRTVKTVLPGVVGSDPDSFLLSGTGGTFDQSTVEAVDISILSQLDPFPSEIVQKLQSLVGEKNLKVNVQVGKPSQEVATLLNRPSPMERVAETWGGLRPALLGGIVGVAAFAIAAIFWMLALFPKQLAGSARTIEAGLLNMSKAMDTLSQGGLGAGTPQLRDVTPLKEKSKEPLLAAGPQGDAMVNTLRDLNHESILALFTDAYWCEEDAYAAWIWSHLTATQRTKLVSDWDRLVDYLGAMDTSEALALPYHMHPYYLAPLPLENLSQQDLAKWVEKNQGIYKSLSPLRQDHLPLSVEVRLQALNAKPAEREIFKNLPTASQPRRLQQAALGFQTLNLEDEDFIWNNHEQVPVELMGSIPTLVWFARLDSHVRGEILNQMSAQDIADCMLGPEPVLNSIRECLPGKKLALVESYLSKSRPSRHSTGFQHVFRKSIEHYKNHGDEGEGRVA